MSSWALVQWNCRVCIATRIPWCPTDSILWAFLRVLFLQNKQESLLFLFLPYFVTCRNTPISMIYLLTGKYYFAQNVVGLNIWSIPCLTIRSHFHVLSSRLFRFSPNLFLWIYSNTAKLKVKGKRANPKSAIRRRWSCFGICPCHFVPFGGHPTRSGTHKDVDEKRTELIRM